MDGFNFAAGRTTDRERLGSVQIRRKEDLTARLAVTSRDHIQAYALRHAGYRSYGYIEAQPHDLFYDDYDDKPNSRTILIFRDGRPAATVRLNVYDTSGAIPGADVIPSSAMFGKEITEVLEGLGPNGTPGRAVEINRLARHPDFADDNDLVFALYRAAGYMILHFDADVVIGSVRAHHVPFYRRMGFRQMAEPRPYAHLTFNAALMVYLRRNFDQAQRRIPILESVSRHDAVYGSLIGGELVRIFPDDDRAGAGGAVEAASGPADQPASGPARAAATVG